MVGGGDGDTRAGRRVLSGGNLNLQTRQSGNGAWAGHAGRGRCVVRGAVRGWDRGARGSTEAQVARAGPEVGLQAFGGRYEVPVRTPATGLSSVYGSPAALPLWRKARAHREEAPSGPTHPFPPSLPPSWPAGLLDPVVCACGPSVTKGRSSGSRGKLPLANHSRRPRELGCQCDACKVCRRRVPGGQCVQALAGLLFHRVYYTVQLRNLRGPKHQARWWDNPTDQPGPMSPALNLGYGYRLVYLVCGTLLLVIIIKNERGIYVSPRLPSFLDYHDA